MSKHVVWLLIAVLAYFIGAKFPMLAQKTGLV